MFAYQESVMVQLVEESCANDGGHTEINKHCQECKHSLLNKFMISPFPCLSFCMAFPLVLI